MKSSLRRFAVRLFCLAPDSSGMGFCHRGTEGTERIESPEVGARRSQRVPQARVPHPGCFRKRAWICLIAKELAFLGATRRQQADEKTGLATEAQRAQRERGKWGRE